MEKQIMQLFNNTFYTSKRNSQSISEIEKNVRLSSKAQRLSNDKLSNHTQSKQLQVISPFYDRNKVCKTINCHCPYHKRIKQQTIQRNRLKPQKCTNSVVSSPKKYDNNQIKEQRFSQLSISNQNKQDSLDKIKMNNNQFNEFLKLRGQIGQKKVNWKSTSQHISRVSVGEIFKFLYDHLDLSVEEIQKYVEQVEKDRDISHFYVQRFDDMKQRRNAMKKNTKLPTFFSKRILEFFKQQENQDNEDVRIASRVAPKFFQKQSAQLTMPKKVNKIHAKKLMIQQIIKDIQNGRQINRNSVKDISSMKLNEFQQNLLYLSKKIETMTMDELNEVKQQILLKLADQLGLQDIKQPLNQSNTLEKSTNYKFGRSGLSARKTRKLKTKLNNQQLEAIRKTQNERKLKQATIASLLRLIEQKLKQMQKQKQNHRQPQTKQKSIDLNQQQKQNTKQSQATNLHKRLQALLNENNKKIIKIDLSKEQLDEAQQKKTSEEKGKTKLSIEKCQLDTVELQQTESNAKKKIVAARVNSKLKLAKFRKLSHDLLFRRTLLDQQNQPDSPIPKIDEEEINEFLDQLQNQWQKRRELQLRITSYHMKQIIIDDSDSLFTIKRKARVLKQLLQEDDVEITEQIKKGIRQYVTFIEKIQLVKNRRWAEQKLRHSVLILENDFAEIGDKVQYNFQDNLQSLINKICTRTSALCFYNIFKTQTISKSVLFQNSLSLFLLRSAKLDSNFANLNECKTIQYKQQTVEVQQLQSKQEDLVQTDLPNRYFSFLFFEQTINFQSSTQKIQQSTDSHNKQVSQQHFKILSLLNKYKKDFQ